ncbi:MAG: hypothetical protein ACLPX9_13255 [Rhodomicrobium sp.]
MSPTSPAFAGEGSVLQAVYDGFRARGLTVFWSNDIPKGAPGYHAIIKSCGEESAPPLAVSLPEGAR